MLPAGIRASDEAIEMARLVNAATGMPPTTASAVELLVDGAAKYRALLDAVAAALADGAVGVLSWRGRP